MRFSLFFVLMTPSFIQYKSLLLSHKRILCLLQWNSDYHKFFHNNLMLHYFSQLINSPKLFIFLLILDLRLLFKQNSEHKKDFLYFTHISKSIFDRDRAQKQNKIKVTQHLLIQLCALILTFGNTSLRYRTSFPSDKYFPRCSKYQINPCPHVRTDYKSSKPEYNSLSSIDFFSSSDKQHPNYFFSSLCTYSFLQVSTYYNIRLLSHNFQFYNNSYLKRMLNSQFFVNYRLKESSIQFCPHFQLIKAINSKWKQPFNNFLHKNKSTLEIITSCFAHSIITMDFMMVTTIFRVSIFLLRLIIFFMVINVEDMLLKIDILVILSNLFLFSHLSFLQQNIYIIGFSSARFYFFLCSGCLFSLHNEANSDYIWVIFKCFYSFHNLIDGQFHQTDHILHRNYKYKSIEDQNKYLIN